MTLPYENGKRQDFSMYYDEGGDIYRTSIFIDNQYMIAESPLAQNEFCNYEELDVCGRRPLNNARTFLRRYCATCPCSCR